jgi:hypothetical protein
MFALLSIPAARSQTAVTGTTDLQRSAQILQPLCAVTRLELCSFRNGESDGDQRRVGVTVCSAVAAAGEGAAAALLISDYLKWT